MAVKLHNEIVLKTNYEVIRINDVVRVVHKDGRPIRGKFTEINGEMIYIANEVLHLGQIESICRVEAI